MAPSPPRFNRDAANARADAHARRAPRFKRQVCSTRRVLCSSRTGEGEGGGPGTPVLPPSSVQCSKPPAPIMLCRLHVECRQRRKLYQTRVRAKLCPGRKRSEQSKLCFPSCVTGQRTLHLRVFHSSHFVMSSQLPLRPVDEVQAWRREQRIPV